LIIVAADLPAVTLKDVRALAELPTGAVAIAPDRGNSGTNALSLPLPSAAHFQFQFGPGSFALHAAEAARLNLPLTVYRSDTLALDVDHAEDLRAAPPPFSDLL
jgi:2-phospho-L-lactate guanylyltransferase